MKTVVNFEDHKGRILSHRNEYYENGNLMTEGHYSKGSGSWEWDIPIGPLNKFYENGKPQSEEYYDEAGSLEGEAQYFDKNGKLTKRIVFKGGRAISEEIFEEIKKEG
jgi:antitoxin component YwqK of YwqJK toxin-antitoxin module